MALQISKAIRDVRSINASSSASVMINQGGTASFRGMEIKEILVDELDSWPDEAADIQASLDVYRSVGLVPQRPMNAKPRIIPGDQAPTRRAPLRDFGGVSVEIPQVAAPIVEAPNYG